MIGQLSEEKKREIMTCFKEKFDELSLDCQQCKTHYQTCLAIAKEERLALINQKQRNTTKLNQKELARNMPDNKWISVQALTETLWVEERKVRQLLDWMVSRNWWDVKQHPENKDLFMLIQ